MKIRTEARRQAILLTAAGLFQEMGYEGAAMNELAKRCGGSKATLYGYFPSKEALFTAVVETFSTAHLLEALDELNHPPAGASLESQLRHFAARMMSVLTNDESALAVYRMVVAESGRSDVGRLFYEAGPAAATKAVALVLEAAMQRGELRRADCKVAADQFTALAMAEVNMRLFQRAPPPMALAQVEAMVDRALATFFHGYGVPRD